MKETKNKTTFTSVLQKHLDAGKKDEALITAIKADLPDYEERRVRARVKATIKYLSKKESTVLV